MALQLTGAAKSDSIANMQLRLPVVVVGGGLTAIDTATESLAYYPVQVEKFLARYEALVAEQRRGCGRGRLDAGERAIADEFLAHARAIRAERAAAQREGRPPRMVELLQSWGGVTIAYRRRLIDSPSYTLNHEEVEKALEEGIRFAEGLTPLAMDVDARRRARRASQVSMQHNDGDGWHESARDRAAGAHDPDRRRHAAQHRAGARGCRALPARRQVFPAARRGRAPGHVVRGLAKPAQPAVLTDSVPDGRAISFFGDLHPSFSGNVVKAMASAKQGYPIVSRMLAKVAPASAASDADFFARARPRAARDGGAGRAADADDRRGGRARARGGASASSRGSSIGCRTSRRWPRAAAARGWRWKAWRSPARGSIASRGSCRRSCWRWAARPTCARCCSPGEPVVLMGPTGAPTEIEPGETVVLVGGGLGNAVLFSIGQAFRARGLEGALLRRLQEDDRPLQGGGDRGRGRRRRLVLRRGAGIRARRGRRTARSSATSCRRCAAYASGELGAQAIALQRRATASSRSARTA